MDADQLTPGTTLDRYQLQTKLGEGAMGVVWKATHLGLKRPVAIKILKRQFAGDATVRGRFVREGEAAARIRHPNVVEVHDVGEYDGTPYLVMEFLDGESLADKFEREGALPPDEIAEVMLPVLAAVSAAHQEGVIHRDLKPENIFLARGHDGATLPKVLDFGISRVVNDRTGRVRTQVDTILGTPQYMSPEQARAERAIDDRSDQYALGAVLYEAATGAIAFEDGPLYPLLDRIVKGQFRRPRAVRPEVSPELEALILRAMAADPAERFRSLRSMGASLLPFASERARAVWARTFDAREARFGDATLIDESAGPASWADHELPRPSGPYLNDTLPDQMTARPVGAASPRDEAATEVFNRKRPRRWLRALAVGVAVLAIASLVVAVLTVK